MPTSDPALPALPQVPILPPLPASPELPQELPDLPELPQELPDLPDLGDLADLPDLPVDVPGSAAPSPPRHFSIFDPFSPLPRLRSQRRVGEEVDPSEPMAEDEDVEGPRENTCVVCYVQRRTHIAVPCGHAMFCQTCVTTLEDQLITECPVCKTAVSNYIKFYNC